MTFNIEVDRTDLHLALTTLGKEIDKELFEVSRVTANAIDREASSRLARQLGPNATGKTVAGITVIPLGTVGHAVVAERNPYPILPYWLEKGTEKMRPREFFDVAVKLEESAHLRRVDEAVQRAINAKGLGE